LNVSLTPELEELVHERVRSGMYHSASEVVREALRLLKERDELRQYRLEELRREIAIGIEHLEQGQYTVYDENTLAELGESIKARAAQKLADQKKTA
jgi:antitoxin ParD1/3/4